MSLSLKSLLTLGQIKFFLFHGGFMQIEVCTCGGLHFIEKYSLGRICFSAELPGNFMVSFDFQYSRCSAFSFSAFSNIICACAMIEDLT
jgi:hypothetical protein